MDKKDTYIKMVIFGKLLWYKNNKTFHNVLSIENNQLWNDKIKATLRHAASHNPGSEYFPNIL